MDNQLSENKLILLYLIREKENITPAELSDFILFRGYMDYFAMENYITELLESELILRLKLDDKVYYTLHPQGEEVVELFRARIPHSIREDIRIYAQNSFLHRSPLLAAEAQVESDSEECTVTCRIYDYDRSVLEVRVTAGSEEEVNRIRNAWQQKGMAIYWNVLKEIGGKKTEAAPEKRGAQIGGSNADASTERNL
jgi:predicted transcriptional regulator